MQSCHPRSSRPSLMTGMLRRELLLSFSRESSSTCQHTSSFHDEEQHRNPTKMEEPCARTSGCSRTNRGAPQSSAAPSNQCQDLWIDKQGDVNHLTFQLRHQRHSGRDNQQEDQPDACGGGSSSSWLSPYNIKILQTSLHEPLFLLGLLEALEGRSSRVHRISLFGVALDTTVSSRLVKVLQHPDCAIQGLQICRLAPESVPILASTLAEDSASTSRPRRSQSRAVMSTYDDATQVPAPSNPSDALRMPIGPNRASWRNGSVESRPRPRARSRQPLRMLDVPDE